MSKSKRLSSCLLFLAGLRDPESLLYALDVHLVRRILHVRWQPIRVEKSGYFEFRDPDTGLLDSVGDEPAVVCADGTRWWYKDDKQHRDGDAPAVVCADGTRYWYKNGKLHREGDEPAVMQVYGSRCWYRDGKCHREGDKPAVIWADGSCFWYKDGRETAPPSHSDVTFTEQKKQ